MLQLAVALRINVWVWDYLFYDLLGLAPSARSTETIHFFIYDSIEIGLLLVGIILAITLLRSYVDVTKARAFLGGKRGGVGINAVGYLFNALLAQSRHK